MLRRWYWVSVLAATILPGISSAGVEYLISGGVSGWIPIWSSLIGGGFAAVVLLFIKVPEVQVGESSKPDEPSNKRIFINKPPHELTTQAKGLTSVGSKHVVERYKGAWIKVQGKIEDVYERGDTLALYTSKNEIGPLFTLNFNKNKWIDKLKILDQGDSITVIGQISDISEYRITLENCEIVDS